MDRLQDDVIGRMQIGADWVDVPRCSVMSPLASATGALEAMALYAGHSVDFIHDVRPAGELVAELAAAAAEACLHRDGADPARFRD